LAVELPVAAFSLYVANRLGGAYANWHILNMSRVFTRQSLIG